jgi:hypothetical protein
MRKIIDGCGIGYRWILHHYRRSADPVKSFLIAAIVTLFDLTLSLELKIVKINYLG